MYELNPRRLHEGVSHRIKRNDQHVSSPHFRKREKSGLLNNLQKLVQSIIEVKSSDTPPTCVITAQLTQLQLTVLTPAECNYGKLNEKCI